MSHNENIMATLRTETIPLSCLSPQQAADIINPYIRSRSSAFYLPSSGISAITVRGTAEELVKSRNLIREFENDPAAACRNVLLGADSKTLRGTLADPLIGTGEQGAVIDKVPTAPKKQ